MEDTPPAVPGFYVAWGPWLDNDGGPDSLYKVGHTGDLRARLNDDAYITNFPPGHWRYVFTFETETKAAAFRLEAGVLHCAQNRRLGDRELVRMGRKEIEALAAAAADALEVEGAPRTSPVYPFAARRAPPRAQQDRAPPLLGEADHRRLDPLKVAAAGETLDDLVDELLDEDLRPPDEDLRLPDKNLRLPDEDPRPAPRKTAEDYLQEARARLAAPEEEDEDPNDLADLLAPGFDALDIAAHFELEERTYQTEAIAACLAELKASSRAVLQMACRCGKTRVAHGVIADYCASRGAPRILFLVPGLALLRQTAQKLDSYELDVNVLLVGSDDRPLPPFASLRPVGPQTTDTEGIARACQKTDKALLVISTYQSSPGLPDVFDLTVFDESHRVCGERKARAFTHVLLTFTRGDRLYMTATPRYDAPLSMKDRALFGGVAYAYHMREGIDAKYVNRFSLELCAAAPGCPAEEQTASQVLAAMGDPDVQKLLVFCRSIRHANELRRAVEALTAKGGEPFVCLDAHSRMSRTEIAVNLARFCAPGERAVLFNCRLFQEGVEIPALNAVFFASPRHSPRDIIQTLCRPLNVLPGKPASKIFLPVDVDLSLPPEDVNNLKRFATIVPFFDALIGEDPLLYEHLLDPKGAPYPLRWVDSAARLPAQETRLRYDPDALLAAVRRAVRRGVGKTERLLRAATIPWQIGFGELERIVRSCGRYPKTTDCYQYSPDAKVNFGQFYRYVRESYAKWRSGQPQPLEPHQLRQLETLPGWDPYGIEGPYPWRETLAFLEKWLGEHGGVPPMVEINCGGYVGLEATGMERLSGTLTCINQGDGRDRKSQDGAPRPGSGFTLERRKQQELDALCTKWGLRWRKERHPPPEGAPEGSVGSLVENDKGEYDGAKTFIQEAYARFKEEWYQKKAESEYVREWFKDYPLKHKHQERPDVWARRKEIIPPRWRKRAVQGK